jgi:hypothetical protein
LLMMLLLLLLAHNGKFEKEGVGQQSHLRVSDGS